MKDQAHSLRMKIQQANKPSAKTIAVVSGKGGVGKSNISVNTAYFLEKNNHKTLLFDLDIGMGNIDILLGSHSKGTIIDFLNNPDMTLDEVISTDANGISYIGGGNGLKSIVEWEEGQLERFFNAMNELNYSYDYIIFDMGAGATKESLILLKSVDYIFCVTTPEPTSLTDAYSMIKYIYGQDQTKEFYLVCNRAETEAEGRETLERLQTTISKFLQKQVNILGVLPEDKIVKKAVGQQKLFSVIFPNSSMTKSLTNILGKFLNGETTDKLEIESDNFMKRFGKLLFRR